MATTTKFTEPIPDRRRTRFAPNGGPRPSPAQRRRAKRGLAAARETLAETDPGGPRHDVVNKMTADQIADARRAIAAAREALSA